MFDEYVPEGTLQGVGIAIVAAGRGQQGRIRIIVVAYRPAAAQTRGRLKVQLQKNCTP
jgi:hypothetical protein